MSDNYTILDMTLPSDNRDVNIWTTSGGAVDCKVGFYERECNTWYERYWMYIGGKQTPIFRAVFDVIGWGELNTHEYHSVITYHAKTKEETEV